LDMALSLDDQVHAPAPKVRKNQIKDKFRAEMPPLY
jgi:hypothetical protein